MHEIKKRIEAIIDDINEGNIEPALGIASIRELKEEYIRQLGSPSWNSYFGKRLQGVIHALLKAHIKKLKNENPAFEGLTVMSESEVKKNEVIMRKLLVKYGSFLLLPDVDSVIAWLNLNNPWESEVIAIVSCKASLRERIAQACYWKLKLLDSNVTKNVKVFLATTDNDDDFILKDGRGRYQGMSRNRVISEHELDGIYILREDFRNEYESKKVKNFERITNDLVALIDKTKGI